MYFELLRWEEELDQPEVQTLGEESPPPQGPNLLVHLIKGTSQESLSTSHHNIQRSFSEEVANLLHPSWLQRLNKAS